MGWIKNEIRVLAENAIKMTFVTLSGNKGNANKARKNKLVNHCKLQVLDLL